jgi:nicotinamidase-related amidase
MRVTRRLTASQGALLIVDLQAKLVPVVADGAKVVANASRLNRGARLLGMLAQATEQYPEGLGPTVPAIAELIPDRPAKTAFPCCSSTQVMEQFYGRQVRHVTVAGIEAHVCVAQTALDLLDLGFRVQVVADAVGSRDPFDRDVALRRLESSGAVISSTEAVLFEWCETSDRPEFKAISALVKERV